MTLDDVILVVAIETGKTVSRNSKLADLVDDSLEFTNLILSVSEKCGEIPDSAVAGLETVLDLYLAAKKELVH